MIIGGNNNGNRNPLAKSPEFNNKFRQSSNTNFVKNNNPQQPLIPKCMRLPIFAIIVLLKKLTI